MYSGGREGKRAVRADWREPRQRGEGAWRRGRQERERSFGACRGCRRRTRDASTEWAVVGDGVVMEQESRAG